MKFVSHTNKMMSTALHRNVGRKRRMREPLFQNSHTQKGPWGGGGAVRKKRRTCDGSQGA
jgi:hypothetical protein